MLEFRWDDLRLFLAVYRGRSINAAAAKLQVNQSTVSRRLSALEEVLGVTLFDRLPEGALPTEAAERILAAAERAEAAAGAVGATLSELEAAPEGRVRLASLTSLLSLFVVPRLPRLLSRYPGLSLELTGGSQVSDLSRREADLAIRLVRPTTSDLVFRRIGALRAGVFAAPAYAARVGRRPALDTLDWLNWDGSLSGLPEARWYQAQVKTPPRLSSDNREVLTAAARAGLGAIFSAQPMAELAGLVELDVDPDLVPRRATNLWLVGHRALREVPRVKAVWEWIVEEAATLFEQTRSSG